MHSDELCHFEVSWKRELMLRVRLIDSKVDRLLLVSTGAAPTRTSPPSSPSPTASPSMSQASSLKTMASRIMQKVGREAIVSIIMWAVGKLGYWLLTLVLPGLISFGALAWMLLRRWLMG